MLFLVSKDGQELGPFTIDQVNQQLAGGMLEPSDLGWTEGFEDWYPLADIEGFVIPSEEAAAPKEIMPQTENPLVTAAGDELPEVDLPEEAAQGLMTAGEAGAKSGGRAKWFVGFALVAALGAGAFVVFGGNSKLQALCQVKAKIHPKGGLPGKLESKLTNLRKALVTLSDGNHTIAESRMDQVLKMIKSPPIIVRQPVGNQTVVLDGNASFSINATGAESFQWQNKAGADWVNISGATSARYTITDVNASHAGLYRVGASNVFGTTQSADSELVVEPGQPPSPPPSTNEPSANQPPDNKD